MITYLQANLIDLISTLPTTKMSCMLKHFRFCVSAGVELLCLIGEWRPQCNCVTVNNRPEIIYGLYNLCNRPVKRLILVARLPRTALLYWTPCWLELWDSDAVFITQNWDVG